MRDRKMQRALMQFFKPENWFTVREALLEAKRPDLIGSGAVEGDHYHTVANPAKGERPGERGAGPPKPTGYRPGRKSQQRRSGKKKGGGPKP